MVATVTLQIPDRIYQRLLNTADATKRPLEEVILHALKVGSPPEWDDVPEEFQAELASLDRLDDDTLWRIAGSHKTAEEMVRYDELLDQNQNGKLTEKEKLELTALRKESEQFMLCKAQAVALLHWRGYRVPHS
ncbi:hypothetical protein [Iningainema tapete]|uniref:Uncharacterized protein n=1 Tax=Iningainema tapete BLCC-T55 TaxID=2748662 RepID=A0A8J7BZE2_9CYAN|nr:hypothetical protein [Iningainema tapete]MBD2777452.1 hypothetical protein [Iningainema tapete BLCC-T55]